MRFSIWVCQELAPEVQSASPKSLSAKLRATSGLIQGYVTHSLFTNLRFEPDEFNFFRERRTEGTRSAFHSRDDRYS